MKRTPSLLLLLLGLSLLAGSSCALQDRKSSRSTQLACVLPTDQRYTLTGRWSLTPVQIAVQVGMFSVSEKYQIMEAARTWNDFFAESMGKSGVDYLEDGQLRESATPFGRPNCADTVVQDGRFIRSLGIFKTTSGWSQGSQVIGATWTCDTSTRYGDMLTNAAIELNYQNFWGSNPQKPDLQTIVLHELGHLMGLKHSCSEGEAGIPYCQSAPRLYTEAVMRPSFGFANYPFGDQVRDLRENDESRMNCLYK
jgi:hypothetical protein